MMKRTRNVLLTRTLTGAILTLAFLGVPIRSQTADRATESDLAQHLKDLTFRYYKDIEANDPEDQRSLFSPKSTDGSANPRPYDYSEDRKIEKFEIHGVEIDGETANVNILVRVSGTRKQNGKPVGGWWNREAPFTHRFVKEGGKWLMMEIVPTFELVAAEMWKHRTKEGMRSVLPRYSYFFGKQFLLDISGAGLDYAIAGDDLPRSITFLNLVLDLAEGLGDQEVLAYTYQFLGVAYVRKGDFGPALVNYQKYYTTLESMKDPSVANALNSFAATYNDLGDPVRGLEFLQRSYSLYEGSRTEGEARVLGNIGSTYLELARYEDARRSFEKVLSIGEEKQIERVKKQAHLGLAELEFELGDYDLALKECDKVLRHNSDRQAKYTEFSVAKLRSKIFSRLGKFREALNQAIDARNLADELRLRRSEWELELMTGVLYLRLAENEKAREAFEASVNSVEELRQNSLGTEYSQQQFFANKSAPYREYSLFLAGINHANEAFQVAERGKAGVLLSALTDIPGHARRVMTEAEKERESQLIEEVLSAGVRMRWLTQVSGGNREQIEQASKDLDSARTSLETFRIAIYAAHPELSALNRTKALLTREEARAVVGGKVSALEFVIGDNASRVFSITDRRKGSEGEENENHAIEAGEQKLSKLIEQFRTSLAGGDLGFRKASRELYDLLIKPVEKELAGKTNIIIVPDGPLWDLPFQALLDSKGKYLIEKAAVSYAPSLTALREMSKRAKSRSASTDYELIAFGNPTVGKETADRVQRVFMSEKLDPLPEAERLVNELGNLYGKERSKVFVKGEARESIAKSEIPKYRIVQFATHGILNNISPMYSHLVMAQNTKDPNEDGLLEAWELKDLDLNADLVILSACDTARGKISGGEGVIGMSWAAFIAGAPSIVASQWKVESSSTTELMLEFHRQLLSKKHPSKAEALRQASLKLMRSKEYSHPSYWAGFIVVGDGN